MGLTLNFEHDTRNQKGDGTIVQLSTDDHMGIAVVSVMETWKNGDDLNRCFLMKDEAIMLANAILAHYSEDN